MMHPKIELIGEIDNHNHQIMLVELFEELGVKDHVCLSVWQEGNSDQPTQMFTVSMENLPKLIELLQRAHRRYSHKKST